MNWKPSIRMSNGYYNNYQTPLHSMNPRLNKNDPRRKPRRPRNSGMLCYPPFVNKNSASASTRHAFFVSFLFRFLSFLFWRACSSTDTCISLELERLQAYGVASLPPYLTSRIIDLIVPEILWRSSFYKMVVEERSVALVLLLLSLDRILKK